MIRLVFLYNISFGIYHQTSTSIMFFRKVKCFFAENRSLRAEATLTTLQRRVIRNALAENYLEPPLHFDVAFLRNNAGIYARLLMLRRQREYHVIKRRNMLIIVNLNQELHE